MKKRFAIVVAAAVLACGGDPVDPGAGEADPGFVTVSMVSGTQGVGAVWLTITGSALDSVRTIGFGFFGGNASPGEHSALVTGALVDGEVVRFWVPDRRDLTGYSVALNEAAAAGSYQQLPTSGFTLTLASAGT